MKQTEVNWRKAIFSTISRDRCSMSIAHLQAGSSSCAGRAAAAAESWGEKDQRIAEKMKKKLCKLKIYGKKVQV